MGKRKHEADSVAEIKSPTTEGEVKSKKQKVKVKKEKAAQHGTPIQPAAAPESAAKPDKLKRKKKGNKRKKDKEKKKKRKDKEQQAAQQLANSKAHTPASQPQPDARGAEGPASTSGRKEGAQPAAGSKPEVSRKKSKPAAAPSPAASPAAAGVAVAHSAATPCVDVWRRRCLRFVELCSNSDSTDILSQGLGTWPTEDVLQLFKDCSLSLDTFGAVCYSWSAAKAAQVLGGMKGSEVAKVCESWDVERITEVLPLLEKDKLLRKVLGRLYFKSKDPYLAPFDCRGIVEALPMQRHTVCACMHALVKMLITVDC